MNIKPQAKKSSLLANAAGTKASLKAPVNGFGALRSVLEKACTMAECGLSDLTVLSAQVDPYRLDTPSGHRDGKWLAEHLDRLVGRSKKIHWRGVHYVLVATGGLVKPNGEVYVNDDDNWTWLVNTAGKAARWLGYIDFERITDNRNAEPFIHHKACVRPKAFVTVGVEVAIPDVSDMEPAPATEGFVPRQAYHFVIFGEKASLEDVVLPIARAKQVDLYLPTGEISDTLLYRIAKDAAADGRPMVMFTLADCDPAGRQMSVSIGRKLQAFRDFRFPKLNFEIVPIALTVEQVRELGLPSTPLKETEKRADRWRQAFGVEQTELDALASLQPNVLRQIIEAAFEPYYDASLEDRVDEARTDWMVQAQAAIDRQVDPAMLAALRTEAAERLAELASVIADLNERFRLTADRFTQPAIEVPQPELDGDVERQALVNFDRLSFSTRGENMRISTEICFTEPCDPDGAVAALRERGYQINKVDDLMDDVQVQAVFVHVSRDVTDVELAGTPGDRWTAGGLVLHESNEIVKSFGGSSDNAG